MNAVTKHVHRGRWRLLCHISRLLCRIFHGRGYGTVAAVLYHLTIEDLETLKSCLYHRITGRPPTSDDLVERLIHMAGRMSRGPPQNGLLQRLILQVLDHGTTASQAATTSIAPSLAGVSCPREPFPSHQPGLPRAERVFDLLMARDAMQREHPSQLSSVLVHLASVVELDAFETVRPPWLLGSPAHRTRNPRRPTTPPPGLRLTCRPSTAGARPPSPP